MIGGLWPSNISRYSTNFWCNIPDASWSSPARKIAWMMIALGSLIRLRLYLVNRSLWSDEARLALNLIDRTFMGLWKPLDWQQGAPVGFLMMQKAAITALGDSEQAMRLIPLLAGVLSLFLFYRLARMTVRAGAGLAGLGMMSVSRELIYYSSELKQYSTDVAVAIVILLIAARCFEEIPVEMRHRRLLVWGGCSAVLLWFSHPAVFVIAGTGMVLIVANRKSLWLTAICAAAVTGVSFAVDFALVLQPLHQSVYLHEFWQQGGFMPRPIGFRSIGWLWQTFYRAFRTPGGFKVPVFTPIVFIVGVVCLSIRKRWLAMLFLIPPLVALAAAAADEYPYLHRLILFVLPMLFIISGVGLSTIWESIPGPRWLTAGACVALMFGGAVFTAAMWVVKPEPVEEIKPILGYLQKHRQNDEGIYVYWAAEPAMRYYAPRYGIDLNSVTIGTAKDDAGVELEVQQMPNETCWCVFNQDENRRLHAGLTHRGRELESIIEPGVSAYRIALRGKQYASGWSMRVNAFQELPAEADSPQRLN